MLLEGKNANVYGGGGAIGAAIGAAFAREGARVHLAGRTEENLERVANRIRDSGGQVETAELDVLDEAAVDRHADAVTAEQGGIDISINTISLGEVFGSPLAESLTARAAARHMIPQKSGVILTFGGYGAPPPDCYLGGFQVGLSARPPST